MRSPIVSFNVVRSKNLYRSFFMALVSMKGSLSREEQDTVSGYLSQMGVSMSWNGSCFQLVTVAIT